VSDQPRSVPVRLAPRPVVTESAVGSPPPPAAPDSGETVSFEIDGREVVAPKGQLLIEAADAIGIYIPRFCYHPRMKPVGMCRMCLVEVVGPRGSTLMPACYNPVADGMKVLTTSPKTKKAQDGVLEFLLVNHPLDCPVCDKGGECPLQDQTLAYGPGESRFVEEKRHWDKPTPISELVNLDRERCIQCGRCVRFADEVAGDPLIDFGERGDRTEVITFADSHPFSSYFSGNIVQICPVGALTATPYRFRARPWDLEQVESTCSSCSVGCRVAVQSSTDQLVRKTGIDSDPVNWAWLCDKGRFDFQAVNSPARLSAPLLRRGDELVEVSWPEALEAAAEGIRRAVTAGGGRSVAVIGGSRLPNEDAYAWGKLARTVIGTDNLDAQLGDGVPAEVLLGLERATIDQAASAGLLVSLGTDPKEELPVLYLRLREAVRERGLQIVEASPTRTGLSPHAAVRLRHLPGGLAELMKAITAGDEPAGDVAGVPLGDISAARAHLARATTGVPPAGGQVSPESPRVVVLLGRASLAGSDADLLAAVAALAQVPGVAWLSGLRRSNVHGALDVGLAPGVLPGRVGLAEGRAWFEQQWRSPLPDAPGLDTAGILAAAARGRIGALVLLGADPEADFPDTRAAVQGLDGARFVVAVDAFLTDSSRKADVILPAATYAERRGSFTNLEGRISHLGAIVTAPGVAWPDWMVASELAFRLGGDLGFSSVEEIWDEIVAVSPLHAGASRSLLNGPQARDGIVVPVPDGGPERRLPRPLDPMADPGITSAQLHTVPPGALALDVACRDGEAGTHDAAGAEAGAPEVARLGASEDGDDSDAESMVSKPPMLRAAPVELAGAAERSGASPGVPSPPVGGELRLVIRRSLWDAGTAVSHSPHLAGLARAAGAVIHPSELEARGLRSGAPVDVSTARGRIRVPVSADPDVPPGVVLLPFAAPAVSVSSLASWSEAVVTARLEEAIEAGVTARDGDIGGGS
jgi:NADH-quinone oxidoreductase subunit G